MKSLESLKGSKPNILFIISDDHGYGDLSFKGLLDDVKTPNLDRLRKSGMLIEQGYVSAPVCSPSRAGLIVGSYQQRWGAKYFGSSKFAPESVKTIPEILKTVGYRTGYFGKVHYGPDKPGSRSCPENHGFDESFYGLAAMGMGRLHYLTHEFNAKEKFGQTADVTNMYPMFENGKAVESHNFLTYEFADRAMNFMAKDKKPYFCMVAFNAVHNFTWQLPDEELEKRGLPKLEDFKGEEIDYMDWYDGVIMPNLENGREYYLAQLELMDKKIGEMIDKIEELGQKDNTLVVYTTDNGGSPCNYGNNSPLTGSKYTLYEGGTRVPFMFSWNSVIEPNSSSRNLTSTLDLLSTFSYLADAQIPETNYCDGINIMPTLLGQDGGHENLFFDTGYIYSVRNKDWKLISSSSEESKNARKALLEIEHADIGEGEKLFKISSNIDESDENNLIDENEDITARLREAFMKWKKEVEETQYN